MNDSKSIFISHTKFFRKIYNDQIITSQMRNTIFFILYRFAFNADTYKQKGKITP
jgi:hypothetical protein